jgi:DNA polymerase III delta subunit
MNSVKIKLILKLLRHLLSGKEEDLLLFSMLLVDFLEHSLMRKNIQKGERKTSKRDIESALVNRRRDYLSTDKKYSATPDSEIRVMLINSGSNLSC